MTAHGQIDVQFIVVVIIVALAVSLGGCAHCRLGMELRDHENREEDATWRSQYLFVTATWAK